MNTISFHKRSESKTIKSIGELEILIKSLKQNYFDQIIRASDLICNSLKTGGTIFFCGNGGSASDSQHLTSELIGQFQKKRKSLKAISLNSDSSVITCVSNDFSYEEIFSRQLEGLANGKDILIIISTSGESNNIINALIKARELKMTSIGFLGKGGGRAKNYCDKSIIIPSNSTARIQEMHILLGHIMCEIIEDELGLN